MDKSREQEKKELMDKVFGKNAPDRSLTADEIAVLKNNPFTGESLDKEFEALKENSEKLKKQSESIMNIFSEADLDKLSKDIKTDFGVDFPIEKESSLNIIFDQETLNIKFIEIEKALNEDILLQENYINSLCKAFRRPLVMGQQPSGLNAAILISGPQDTGRHSSINRIAQLMVNNELLSNDNVTSIDLGNYSSKDEENNFIIDLYGAINNSQVIIFDNVDYTSASYLAYIEEIVLEGKLSLNKRYVLNNKQLVETSNALAKNTVKELSFKGKYLVFITTKKVNKLLNVVGSRFINNVSDTLTTSAFNSEDIVEIYKDKFKDFQNKTLTTLNISLNSDPTITDYLLDKYNGSNVKFVNDCLQNIYNCLSEYKLSHPVNQISNIVLSYHDGCLYINDEPTTNYLPEIVDNAIEEVKEELDNLVGLTEVKDYIYSLQDFYAAQEKRKAQGLTTTEVSKHMIFTGNPGTGKTTIARLLAKYLKAIGVLSNGQLIEVSRSDLVGKYVGHTAPLTMQVIKSAVGGILFIDEAYSLYRGENDSFGLECIDTLVKAMEDNREDLIVILAGYTKEMSTFLESNSGLQSRFPNQIEFPDYTGEELFAIAKINAKSAGYRIDDNAQKPLTDYFTKVQENDSVRSGNGRLSRNMVEEAIINQSKRIIKDEKSEIDLLILEDFDLNV